MDITIEWLFNLIEWLFDPTNLGACASVATLGISWIAYLFARKSYHQIDREEPWKLTPLFDNYWLIERIHPNIATIYGQFIYPNIKEVYGSGDFVAKYSNAQGKPFKYFKRGTKMVVEIPSMPVGSSFHLAFHEHKSIKKALKDKYVGELSMNPISEVEYISNSPFYKKIFYRYKYLGPCERTLKLWEAPLYPTSR